MEASPNEDLFSLIKTDLLNLGKGDILLIHSVYYWTLVTDKNAFMAHLVVKDKNIELLDKVQNLLKGYKVKHSAIQLETMEEYMRIYKGHVIEL